MPSAADFNSSATATTLCSNFAVLVNEAAIQPALKPTPVGGASHIVLNEANYRLHFTVAPFPNSKTSAVVNVLPGTQIGALPLFFLPWLPDHATTMTLPNGAGPSIFMTSTLTGCTVQVVGPANSPTITHANAMKAYKDGYGRAEAWAEGSVTAKQQHDYAELRADAIATGKINTMLPAAGGAVSKVVRKTDYAAKVDSGRVNAAQRRIINTLPRNQTLGDFKVDMSNQVKPEIGAFVYGIRDAAGNWTFWYQTYVGCKFTIEDKFGASPASKWPNENIPLGAPEQLFP